jgi:hypothetical protein
MTAKRVITLAGVSTSEKLQNIYHLVLEHYSLDSLSKVGNIHHLEIRGSFALLTTEKLGTVTGSLVLGQCPNLTSVAGLENIPEGSISDCRQIVDFTGLGHHQKLTVDSSFGFQKLVKEFKKRRNILSCLKLLNICICFLKVLPLLNAFGESIFSISFPFWLVTLTRDIVRNIDCSAIHYLQLRNGKCFDVFDK